MSNNRLKRFPQQRMYVNVPLSLAVAPFLAVHHVVAFCRISIIFSLLFFLLAYEGDGGGGGGG
jgi:hypothetical protein